MTSSCFLLAALSVHTENPLSILGNSSYKAVMATVNFTGFRASHESMSTLSVEMLLKSVMKYCFKFYLKIAFGPQALTALEFEQYIHDNNINSRHDKCYVPRRLISQFGYTGCTDVAKLCMVFFDQYWKAEYIYTLNYCVGVGNKQGLFF